MPFTLHKPLEFDNVYPTMTQKLREFLRFPVDSLLLSGTAPEGSRWNIAKMSAALDSKPI